MTIPPRSATTVVLLRASPVGPEVFLVQRNRSVGFMPTAWVFPGGRVDDGDRLLDHPMVRGRMAIDALDLPAAEAVAHLVAGIRETFEESGVWLGDGDVPSSARYELASRAVDLAGVLARTGAKLDLDRLVAWSWWVTPEIEPKRFDTRFFVAVTGDVEASHDDGETVASAWMRPADAVARAEAGELPMAPPTWWTLYELSQFGSVEAVLAAAPHRSKRAILPILGSSDDAPFELRLPGHPEHPDPAIPGLPTFVRFVQGRWWADVGSLPRL